MSVRGGETEALAAHQRLPLRRDVVGRLGARHEVTVALGTRDRSPERGLAHVTDLARPAPPKETGSTPICWTKVEKCAIP